MTLSALTSWNPDRWSALSGIAPFSQVSVKQSTAEFKKSLFVRVRSCSSSDLFARERRFARWILGSGVLKPRCLDFTSKPARFPRLRRLERLNRNAAPLTKMSSKTSECSNVGKRLSGVLFLMSKSSFLVKLIGKSLLKTGQTNKNRKSELWWALMSSARPALLFLVVMSSTVYFSCETG